MTIKNLSIKISILIMIFIVIILSGCFSHWQGDLAQIVISFGGAERKIYDPEDTETHNKLEHEVVLTSGTKKLTFNKSGATFETTVAPGEWNITVNSWIDGEIYATGSDKVILKPGLNNITIDMEQVIFWWAWDSELENRESTTNVTLTPTDDRSGYDALVSGKPNEPYQNWKSQVGRNYIATAGKTYKASWKWQTTNSKPFTNVTIRYTQENPPEETDILYEFDTNEKKLTIPTSEEQKWYEFTMPENGNIQYNPYFAFLVGEDTGSFRIWDLRIEEVKLPSSIKRITFTHNKGTVGGDGEPYDNWLGFYDIPSSVRGEKIKEDDVFTFNYTFTSDVTVEKDDWSMSIILVDNSEEVNYWKELSGYYPIHNIKAKEEVSGTITFIATETASSSLVKANRLAFLIDLDSTDVRHPTLTFTKFEFKKTQTAESTNRKITFGSSTGKHEDGTPFSHWTAFYDIPPSIRGDRIKEGDVFIFTYSFTSDVAINEYLRTDLNDHSNGWNGISDWNPLSWIQMSGIPAGTVVSGTIIFTANKTASSSAANANRLSFLIDPASAAVKAPILTFTKFSLIKAQPIQGGTLKERLNRISNPDNNTAYLITLNQTENLAPYELSYNNKNVIVILKGDTQERTVNLSSNGSMFTINSGVTLILDNNITLKGRDSNNTSLVRVHGWGTLIMNEGTKIKDNIMTTNNTTSGGGVSINEGTFIMKGGEISGNKSLGPAQENVWYLGGGVQVYKGIFTMEGGKISNNESADSGGGLEVAEDGIFTMSGNAEISNNISYGGVGGVYVNRGIFTMNGGKISGNNGGGVHVVWEEGKFTMNGGEITSNTADWCGGVHVWRGIFEKPGKEDGGNIYGNIGDPQVHVDGVSSSPKERVSDVGPNVSLYYNEITNNFTGAWDN
jgi:hypothetical protein